MTITVSSGVTSAGLRISGGDPVVVLSGGLLETSDILSGASATLSSGALGRSLTVSQGGVLDGAGTLTASAHVAGLISGLTVGGVLNAWSAVEILSGGTASRAILAKVEGENAFTTFTVDSGGAATATVVRSGAFFEDYGVASATIVNNGGEADVFAGGVTTGDTVRAGGSEVVSSGGLASATNLLGGGEEIVYSGGAASGAVAQNGGVFDLFGGTATGVTVQSGGALGYFGDISSDITVGQVTATTVLSGVTVSTGGYIDLENDTVLSGVTVSVLAGGIVEDMAVNAGATVSGPGELEGAITVAGTLDGVTIGDQYNDFNFVEIQSGGVARGVTLADVAGPFGGQTFRVDSGALVTGTIVSAASDLEDYGSAANTVVASGGQADVFAGGVASGATIEAGGTFTVYRGKAVGVVVDSGGNADLDGQVLSSLQVGSVASQVSLGGVTVQSGANLSLHSIAVHSGVTVTVRVGAGDTVDGVVISSGATVRGAGELAGVVLAAGTVSGLTIGDRNNDNNTVSILSGGVARGLVFSDVQAWGGAQTLKINAGASAFDTVISGGSDLYDLGSAVRTTVTNGGAVNIRSGGVASGSTIMSGGVEYVSSGGADGGVVVNVGGMIDILAGGVVRGLSLRSGAQATDDGEVRIAGNAVLAGTLAGSGRVVEVASGVLVLGGNGQGFTGEAVISGGTVELATKGALGSGAVEFVGSTGSATLQIDAADAPKPGVTFANTLSNFDGAGDAVDLASIAYVNGASAAVSGSQLVLTDGAKSYSFNLAGGTAAGGYTVASDGHGGTVIEAQVAIMAQAMAAFSAASGGLSPMSSGTSSSGAALFAAGARAASAGLHG